MAGLNDLLVIHRANNGQVDDSSIPIEMREWFKKVYRQPTTTEPITTEQPINIDEYGGTEDAIIADQIHQLEQQEKRSDLADTINKRDNIIQYDSGLMYNPKTNRYDTPDPIASAIMFAESSGKHNQKSKKGAIGLMQILPKWFTHETKPAGFGVDYLLTKDDLKDPETNFKVGKDYIYGLIKHWKNQGYSEEDAFDLGVMSYNAGVPKVNRYLKQVNREGKKSKVVMENNTQTYLNNVYKALGSKPIKITDKKKIYKKIKAPKEYKKIKELRSGGMVERNYYDYAPRNI